MGYLGSRVGCLVVLCLAFGLSCCYGSGMFGFDIHHRFSDGVKGILPFDDLPEIGSKGYYALMAHRDRMLHGRRLAADTDLTKLTFEYGNETYLIPGLGYLHYANVSMGTPSKSFLVALDTGSDLLWLPCDCTSCIKVLNSTEGPIMLNIYSPNTSTSSKDVPCSSPLCDQKSQCNALTDTCPFNIDYVSANTSANGFLVEDVLHLITDDDQTKAVKPRVTFGCGKELTGSFLKGGAPNGLFGLNFENDSIPSMLASQGLIQNSFSLCIGSKGIGRISFGDLGSADQGETPFTLNQLHPTYYVKVTNMQVGGNTSAESFSAIFDSGTSFTFLTEPTYSFIAENFHSHAKEQRNNNTDYIFEYCYDVGENQTSISYAAIHFTMKGGDIFTINKPLIIALNEAGRFVYCLALLKSENINIIGQNFMTGYRTVYNREKMILGWKKSDCNDRSTTQSMSPKGSPAVPPAAADPPTTTTTVTHNKTETETPPTGNDTPHSIKLTFSIMVMIFFSLLAIL